MIPPVRPIALSDIEAARKRIKATVLRTPLVKLELGADAPEAALIAIYPGVAPQGQKGAVT